MSTTLQWFVPCYFNRQDGSDDEIVLDITDSVKKIFMNDASSKPIDYGNNINLRDIKPEQIQSAQAKILPRFMSGIVNDNRIVEYVESNSSKVYSYYNADGFKKWWHSLGVVCIRVVITQNSSLPSRKEVQDFHYDSNFIDDFHRYRAILREISWLFLSGLHITYPTRSIMQWYSDPINDGVLNFSSKGRSYFVTSKTDSYLHHVLIVEDRLEILRGNVEALASVWHMNLWPLRRYLIAVKSNLVDMDSLLDMIYSLEGLFDKNATADFIKIFCCAYLEPSKEGARVMKKKLDMAFKIRNEIAHGGVYYKGLEKMQLNGKQISAEDLYWDMKTIVSQMLIYAFIKLMKNKEMKNLSFTTDDFFEEIYKKKRETIS